MSDETREARTLSCPHRELAVGWALHALEPADESGFVEHLPNCPECLRTVAETEEVGACLGLSITQQEPSPALERRVLAIPDSGAGASVLPLERRAAKRGAGGGAARPRYRYQVLTAAAAVVLIATSTALGIRVVQLDNELDRSTDQVVAMSEVMARIADPTVARVPLVTDDGRSMGVVLAADHEVAVVPTALPHNRVHDQIYVLWGLDDGAPVPLGGFDVAPDASVLHVIPTAPEDGEFSSYAVSLEPGRDTPAVPTTVIAMGQVQR